MASQNESHSLYVPSDGELPHGGGTSQSPWQSASHAPMLSGGARLRTSSRQGGTSGIIKYNGAIAITEFDGERSICSLSTPTIVSLT